jgi:peroxiredoxin (alkyl hydroperoxide reductase subunit C)
LFGVYDEQGGLAYRGTFIINPNGVLVSSEINYNDVGRNAVELLRKVKANIYIAKHPNEACPAKWEEGDKTLKPGAKLVGKVYQALKK